MVDLLLDLFGGVSRILGDDLRGYVPHIRVGFDGELFQGVKSENGDADNQREHHPPAMEAESDKPANHWNSTPSRASTLSPALHPR